MHTFCIPSPLTSSALPFCLLMSADSCDGHCEGVADPAPVPHRAAASPARVHERKDRLGVHSTAANEPPQPRGVRAGAASRLPGRSGRHYIVLVGTRTFLLGSFFRLINTSLKWLLLSFKVSYFSRSLCQPILHFPVCHI